MHCSAAILSSPNTDSAHLTEYLAASSYPASEESDFDDSFHTIPVVQPVGVISPVISPRIPLPKPKTPKTRKTAIVKPAKKTPVIKGRRGRSFSPMQYSALVMCFKANTYPSHDELLLISRFTGLDLIKTRTWYQNARVRGASEVGVVDLPVTAEQIMTGSVTSVDDLAESRNHAVSAQHSALPAEVVELYYEGKLDTLLVALGKPEATFRKF
ncbi:Homeobox domain [Carpediemonas membranifera]|uniref:Homeobox domain n=1 Tax=Carpediemonas membranifera TaxID=201153 RepID=A0A8J6AVU6_9EUKA|nr:Homeobox domain [Carpediemonas membranifera]|eukprot:KAG9392835.1 Homeobox domain [Carpediemonas membranifera]